MKKKIISYGRADSGDVTGETGPVKTPAVAGGIEQPLLGVNCMFQPGRRP